MQFGKIHGIALAILGIVLLGIQTAYYMMPTTSSAAPRGFRERLIMRSIRYLDCSA
jgi:hypothetical protein